MAPPDLFQHKFVPTILVYMVVGMIASGLISLFKRDLENWIVAKLRIVFHGRKEGEDARAEDSVLDAPPSCPECRRAMLKRIAKRGENRGSSFWGCSAFPNCHGTRAYVRS